MIHPQFSESATQEGEPYAGTLRERLHLFSRFSPEGSKCGRGNMLSRRKIDAERQQGIPGDEKVWNFMFDLTCGPRSNRVWIRADLYRFLPHSPLMVANHQYPFFR